MMAWLTRPQTVRGGLGVVARVTVMRDFLRAEVAVCNDNDAWREATFRLIVNARRVAA